MMANNQDKNNSGISALKNSTLGNSGSQSEPEVEEHIEDNADEEEARNIEIPTEMDIFKSSIESSHNQVIDTKQERDMDNDEKHEIIDLETEIAYEKTEEEKPKEEELNDEETYENVF